MDSSLPVIQSVIAINPAFNAQASTRPTTQSATVEEMTQAIPSIQQWLDYIDVRLLVIGSIVLIGLVLWLTRQKPRNPLAGPAKRLNTLPTEMFALPFLVFLTAGILSIEIGKHWFGQDVSPGVRQSLFSAGWIAGIIACFAIGHLFFEGGLYRFLFGHKGFMRSTAAGALYYLASLPLVTGAYFLGVFVISKIMPEYELADHAALQVLHDPSEPGWIAPWIWMSAVVFAPIGEECFFRGILQSVLLRLMKSKWLVIGVVGILFGAAHANQLHAIFPLAVFGFVLGFACERTGTVWTPIVIHILFNLKSMTWDALGYVPGT